MLTASRFINICNAYSLSLYKYSDLSQSRMWEWFPHPSFIYVIASSGSLPNFVDIIPSSRFLTIPGSHLISWVYLGIKIHKEYRQNNDIKNRIDKGGATMSLLEGVLWNRQITRKTKLQIYYSIGKSTLSYGNDTWKFNKNSESKRMLMEIDFLRRLARCSKL